MIVVALASTFMLHDALLEHADLGVETTEAPLKSLLLDISELLALGLSEFRRLDPQVPDGVAADALARLPCDRVENALRLLELRFMDVIFSGSLETAFEVVRPESHGTASHARELVTLWVFLGAGSLCYLEKELVLTTDRYLLAAYVDALATHHNLTILHLLQRKLFLDVLQFLCLLFGDNVAESLIFGKLLHVVEYECPFALRLRP